MSIVRREDRPGVERGPRLPTLQRLVDRASGSAAVTILINTFTGGEAVPEHTHEVEEVLLVTAGECTGPSGADERVDGLVGEAGDHQPVAQARDRPVWIHVQVQKLWRGDSLDGVVDRSERA